MSRHVCGSRRQAFTLIEVLVVIGIIALLTAILMPALWRARRYSQSAACLANLRSIGIAMVTYSQSNRGWLPAGPADQLIYVDISSPIGSPRMTYEHQEGGSWRPSLESPWQWGGRRAQWQYLEDANGNPLPERLVRPLTSEIYRGASLDSKTPVFRCPADDGLEYWDRAHRGAWIEQGLGRRSIYDLVGNSYFVHRWGGIELTEKSMRSVKRRPGQVVLSFESIFSYDKSYYSPPSVRSAFPDMPPPIRQKGWHGQDRTYNLLYLDGHAEYRHFAPLLPGLVHGKGWVLVNYHALVDYYR